jgi:hypothetical protein
MKLGTIILAGTLTLLPTSVALAGVAEVFKTAGCTCCEGWISHARDYGFELLVNDMDMEELVRIKAQAGVEPDWASCHTTVIEGYVIEGHVPAVDIARLLTERPDALGLAAPGMPAGSPGMEGASEEPYDVLLLLKDSAATVYSSN